MIRKLMIAGVATAALAATGASASSLGDLDDVSIASTSIAVDDCELEDVDFGVGQNLKAGDSRTGDYYTQAVQFDFTDACVGETLDFRLLGAPVDEAADVDTLVSSFDNAIPSDVVVVNVTKTFVEDIEGLTVAVH